MGKVTDPQETAENNLRTTILVYSPPKEDEENPSPTHVYARQNIH